MGSYQRLYERNKKVNPDLKTLHRAERTDLRVSSRERNGPDRMSHKDLLGASESSFRALWLSGPNTGPVVALRGHSDPSKLASRRNAGAGPLQDRLAELTS